MNDMFAVGERFQAWNSSSEKRTVNLRRFMACVFSMERKRAIATIRESAKITLGEDVSRVAYSDPVLQRHLLGRFGKRL
jgi:hypothetical protein